MNELPLQEMVFYLFSFVMLASAIMVVTVRNPVYAALFLILTFFTAAAVWMLLEAEFLAIVLVVVYVGAVMVLFLFVVMMLDINIAPLKEGFIRYLPVGLLVAFVMAAEMVMVLWGKDRAVEGMFPTPAPAEPGYSNTEAVGEWLYTQYLLPFEMAGVILLVAMVAAIMLTLRKRPGVKAQNPSNQVKVRREERIKLISMPSETPNDQRGS